MNDILKMNDRPTPDTDAFIRLFTSIDDPKGNKRWVPSEFARVLERQRDEAREELNNIKKELKQLCQL